MANKLIKLFYSYSHKDESHKERMEVSLAVLKRNGALIDWNDRKIVPGQNIPQRLRNEISNSNIIVFLISPDFLASEACVEEWEYAKQLQSTSGIRLICIIIRDCAWTQFDDAKDFLALPTDGKPIVDWINEDKYWSSVFEGIQSVIDDIRSSFVAKNDFISEISEIEFCSQSQGDVYIQDLFVFPQLYLDNEIEDDVVLNSANDIFNLKHVIIRGNDQSGKTKLCTHLFLEIINNSKPVIYINLESIKHKKPSEDLFKEIYDSEFSGDYSIWKKQDNITVIFDNLSHDSNSLGHIVLAKQLFSNLIITTSNTNYSSFFRDELKLADFAVIRIGFFTHSKQEELIKKWVKLSNKGKSESEDINFAYIDKLERDINSIILSNKVLPRYPFFILSILQTYEAFMPQDTQITAYGHCYYALILARLIKSGIDRADDAIDPCFNFLTLLSFEIFKLNPEDRFVSSEQFDIFVQSYTNEYLFPQSLLNRLISPTGILKRSGTGTIYFSLPYSYYYFLGRHIAKTYNENNSIIDSMLEFSYERNNNLALIFSIHHALDNQIIDDILLHTICTIDGYNPAKLDEHETKVFKSLLSDVPDRILSDKSVEDERKKEREKRDGKDKTADEIEDDLEKNNDSIVNQIYKTQKNMEILSQILKNKYGSLKQDKITEIIETICDAGLRLVSTVLNESRIDSFTNYVDKRYEDSTEYTIQKTTIRKREEIGKIITQIVFVFTMSSIEKIVFSLCKPELRQLIRQTKNKKKTPAYDIIYFFHMLDTSTSIDGYLKDELDELLAKYHTKDMFFPRKVLSLRTQHYLNTHKVKEPIKQSIASLLGIAHKSK